MQVLQLPSNNIISPNYDCIEAQDFNSLSAYNPQTKMFAVILSASTLYYYNGFSWQMLSQNTNNSYNLNKVNNLYLVQSDEKLIAFWDSVNNATFYKIFVKPNGENEYLSGISTSASYNINNLTNDISYQVRVVACNYNLEGISSNNVIGIPTNNSIPNKVENLIVSAGINSAYLTWSPSDNSTQYNIYVTPNLGNEVLYSISLINSITLSGLTQQQIYSFRVGAENMHGEGILSDYYTTSTLIPIPDVVTGITLSPSISSILLTWNSSQYASTYNIYRSSGSNDTLHYYTSSNTNSYLDNSLVSSTTYNYSIIASNSTGVSLSSTVVSATTTTSAFVINESAFHHISFSGMMTNNQPDEGPILEQGRTWFTAFSPLYDLSANYIELIFCNMLNNNVSGLMYRVAEDVAKNSTSYSTNPLVGWVSGTVDISASDSNGHTFKTIRINFPTPKRNPKIHIYLYHPYYTSSNNYARSFTTNGSTGAQKNSIFGGLDYLYTAYKWNYDTSNFIEMDFCDGNYVENITSFSATHTKLSQASSEMYAPNKPSSVPMVGLRFGRSDNKKRKIIECVGDSITVGYNDHDVLLSVEGYPQRLNKYLGSVSGDFEFINFGQSGFRPEQYLARWASYANCNQRDGTALVYSIFSPNGYFDNGHPIGASRNTEIINNCLLAEQYANLYGRLFIPCFVTGTNLYLLNVSTIVKDILVWAQNRYGSRLLDLHNAIQDQTNLLAPYMASQYTDDQTHPNTNGYDALGQEAVSRFISCYNAALTYAGG